MKKSILCAILGLIPMTAFGALDMMPYRVEQVTMPAPEVNWDLEALARRYRYYIGGAYNFSMWEDASDDYVSIDGKNASGFDVVAGVRVNDMIRVELNYSHINAEWNAFELTGDMAFVNALVDARIDNIYRLFRSQSVVPYVGAGVGISWNQVDGTGVQLDKKISPAFGVLAGVGFELGNHFTIDVGYKYLYMFDPGVNYIDFDPTAHQFRAGVRVHF